MRYKNSSFFTHQQQDKIGVLITNLGTPDEPTTSALRRYLAEFLADPRVVEVPRLLWFMILHGVILRIRPRRSAKAYATVFTEEGSPLLFHTKRQCDAIRKQLNDQGYQNIEVDFAMRYGNPSVGSVLDRLFSKGVRKLVVLPLYPQYSAATSASTFDAIAHDFTARRWLPDFRFISHYHDFPPYITAAVEQIKQYWQQHGKPKKLLFSFHGIPKRYLINGDPYHCECHKTARLIAEQLNLSKDDYMTCFQSRFGREEWLKPYTDETLKSLPAEGIDDVHVFCPGFAADCLETIEEIAEENKAYFIEAGGKNYHYIPALNDNSHHIDALVSLIEQNLAHWHCVADPHRDERAKAMNE